MNVTVVGAGIVGLAVAHELASRGAAVRIVEARGVGQGATRASAGMLAPYIEGHSNALLELGVCSLGLYDQFVARVSADAGRTVECRRNGTLQVARRAEEVERLRTAAARLAAAGVEHSLLDAEQVRQIEPALDAAHAALLLPQHGYVVVRSLVAALEAALAARGVPIELRRVEDISAEVRSADAVVIAAGSWSGDIEANVSSGSSRKKESFIKPIRGQLLHLRLPEPPVTHVLWGEGCYIVPWQDGSLLVGATSEDVGFDESATASAVRMLLQRGTALLPVLEQARFEEVRVGLRPATADELPVVGSSSTMRGVFYATGHYRNGVLLAPWTALAVADLVLEGRARASLAQVRPDRVGL